MMARVKLTRAEFANMTGDKGGEAFEKEHQDLTATIAAGEIVVEGEIAPLCHWLGQHDYPLEGITVLPYRHAVLFFQELAGFTEERFSEWLDDLLDAEAGRMQSAQGDWLAYEGHAVTGGDSLPAEWSAVARELMKDGYSPDGVRSHLLEKDSDAARLEEEGRRERLEELARVERELAAEWAAMCERAHAAGVDLTAVTQGARP